MAEHRLPATRNYYFGKEPAQWQLGVALFQTVRFRGVYPGIDLLYRIEDGALENSFVLQPRGGSPQDWHANSEGVVCKYNGYRRSKIGSSGEALHLRKLSAFQMIGPVPVKIAFQVQDRMARLRVGPYRAGLPLEIDPSVSFSAYLGGSDCDSIYGTAADSAGNL